MGLLQRQVLEEVRQVSGEGTVVEAVVQGEGIARTQHDQSRTQTRQGRVGNPTSQEGKQLCRETGSTWKRHIGQGEKERSNGKERHHRS